MILLTTLLFLATSIVLGVSNLRYRKMINDYLSVSTKRIGFYTQHASAWGTSIDVYVHVRELDEYATGYSKIELIRCEANYHLSNYRSQAESLAKDKFVSLRLTKDITWLEGKGALKELRRSKLESLANADPITQIVKVVVKSGSWGSKQKKIK